MKPFQILSIVLQFITNLCGTSPQDPASQQIATINCDNWDNQWKTYHSIKIGLVVDCGFFSRYGNDTNLLFAEIQEIFDNTNSIYEPQLNIHLDPGIIHICKNIPNYGNLSREKQWWYDGKFLQQGCQLSADQISNIRYWNEAQMAIQKNKCTTMKQNEDICIAQYGTWAYLSDCWEGMGISPVNKLCVKDWYNAVNVNYDKDETWLSFAHEIGHNFGAPHFFDKGNGGIMDYGKQQYDGLYQFRDGRPICKGIVGSQQKSPQKCSKCWNNPDIRSYPEYRWRHTGRYGKCFPQFGLSRHRVNSLECIKISKDLRVEIVPNHYCDDKHKPPLMYVECPKTDIPSFQTLGKFVVDATFDYKGMRYIFKGSTVSIGEESRKTISDIFNIKLDGWDSDYDATFIIESILYIIKNRKYIRYDMDKQVLVDPTIMSIRPRNSNDRFGYMPDIFWKCGRIDAAYSQKKYNYHLVTLMCGSISYTFVMDIHMMGLNGLFNNKYRPFIQDFGMMDFVDETKEKWVDAANFDEETQVLRLYLEDDDYFEVNYGKKQQREYEEEFWRPYSDNDQNLLWCSALIEGGHILDELQNDGDVADWSKIIIYLLLLCMMGCVIWVQNYVKKYNKQNIIRSQQD